MSVETNIHRAICHRYEVHRGKAILDPEEFTIGVNRDGWEELGATDDTVEITFRSFGRTFKVRPIEGLDHGEVALIWR